MKYIYILILGFGLLACHGDNNTNDQNSAGTGGDSGSAGAFACGGSTCGACEPGCQANDQCVDGDWLCSCDCDGDDTIDQNDAGATAMGGAAGGAGTGGESGSAGAFACGGSTCGACEPGCQANDRCVDGNWLCGCDCVDEEPDDDCGGASCPDNCVQGCDVVSECVDGMLLCDCDCRNGGAPQLPSCAELCAAWIVNLERCVDGFSVGETFSDACLMQCEALPNYQATLSFANCTLQNNACETVLGECSEFMPQGD